MSGQLIVCILTSCAFPNIAITSLLYAFTDKMCALIFCFCFTLYSFKRFCFKKVYILFCSNGKTKNQTKAKQTNKTKQNVTNKEKAYIIRNKRRKTFRRSSLYFALFVHENTPKHDMKSILFKPLVVQGGVV